MLVLFFRQVSGEGDDVEVDVLRAGASDCLAVAVGAISCHDGGVSSSSCWSIRCSEESTRQKRPNVVRGHLGRMEETEQGSNGRH